MPAYPFGGHPTLAQYLEWASGQGCEINSGYSGRGGRMATMTKIAAPSGRWVIVVGVAQDDYLLPLSVGNLDRRLGLNSPFAKLSNTDEPSEVEQ